MPRKHKGESQERKASQKKPIEPDLKKDSPKEEAEKEGAAEEPREYTELVLLVHAANPSEAELFKTELESHGIPAVLEGEGAGVAGIPDVGAGVPILVPEEFADQAAELIAELESAKPEGNALDDKDDIFEEEEDEEAEEGEDDVEELDELDEDPDEDEDDLDEDDDLDDDDDDLEEDDEEEDVEDEDEDEDEEEWDDEDDEDDDDR